MKTFLGTFKEGAKSYPFNTESDIKIGDNVKLEGYNNHIIITSILDELYEYFTYDSPVLSHSPTSSTGLIKTVFVIKEKE